MNVRVRFAPSPTGNLHIGNARTAIYNYLFARANNGKLILRVEDTDRERSKPEFELSQLKDLEWLGIEFDESPSRPGNYGPYRQSERTKFYNDAAEKLINEKKAYYCFCSDEELTRKKEMAKQAGKLPHYDGTCRHLSPEEAIEKKARGEACTIRFNAPSKAYKCEDGVRGRVVFPENMVGDFVIIRSNGLPTYNYCCVIDDAHMKISHVIRGEDHLNNTVRQLMVYEAIGATPPAFFHVSLLIGNDRQKLSKRHGATSVANYREQNYLPSSLTNYLCLLGWSHPEEKDYFEIASLGKLFDTRRFSKSHAIYDLDKLRWLNGMHIRDMKESELQRQAESFIKSDSEYFKQSDSWRKSFLELYKNQIHFFEDYNLLVKTFFSNKAVESFPEQQEEYNEVSSWETTEKMAKTLLPIIEQSNEEYISEEKFSELQTVAKKELKIKGKPLFKGIRLLFTGLPQGAELKFLIPLTPKKIVENRMKAWINEYSAN